MANSTISQFASELGLPPYLLLEQLKSAGVHKSGVDDNLLEADKTALLDYLRREHGAVQAPKNKITLIRKQNTEINKADSTGHPGTIQVEVRKKNVLKPNEQIAMQSQVEADIDETSKPKSKRDERKLRIKEYVSKARNFLPDHPEAALNTIRKALEAIIRDIIESESDNTEYINKFQNLEDQLSHIRRIIKLPKLIDIHLRTLQSFGNFGSHHQEDELTLPSKELVESNLLILGELIDWHNNRQ